jgi:DNA-binding HxlR family transcriptional regulator
MSTSAVSPDTTPPALAWSTDNCTVGRAMEILGERWTFVVLREVFNGVRRFEDMRRHTSMPRQVLTNRLALLVEHDILRKEPFRPEGPPVAFAHRDCGAAVDLRLTCAAGHEVDDPRAVMTVPGPGARPFS